MQTRNISRRMLLKSAWERWTTSSRMGRLPWVIIRRVRRWASRHAEVAGRLGQELALEVPLVVLEGGDGLGDLGLEAGGAAGELGDLGPVEIDDGGHLVDGRLGVVLGRGLQVVLGPLDQPGDELGPGRGGGDAGSAVLDEQAAERLDEEVVVEEGVVLPGEEVLELEELQVQEVEEHLVLELVVRGELGLVDLGDELLVEAVEGLVELVEGAFARVLELVVVLRVALDGSRPSGRT